jgi:hypothetical protein
MLECRASIIALNVISDHGTVEIYAAFNHMWENAASGSPVLGSAPDTRQV